MYPRLLSGVRSVSVLKLQTSKPNAQAEAVAWLAHRRPSRKLEMHLPMGLEKKFWQGKNTEKMLYGVDDIVDADEIIIVEGEIDKLSVEEAGYCNCVSVPGGAPQKVSLKEIPSQEKDTGFQYIWNCSDYFQKASRIILATDDDSPGQALAEELARRLGKERCWRVHWPRKDDVSLFKDANEVLKNLGADALRDAIDKAELYEMHNLE